MSAGLATAPRRTRVQPGPRRRRAAHPRGSARPAPRRSAGEVARQSAGGLLDRLLRGRGWLALLSIALAGVVFLNVTVLQVNGGITRDAERAERLQRDNAGLRLRVAELASSERVQRAAAELGYVLPAPGEVRYLTLDPRIDARRAASRLARGGDTPPVAAEPPPAPTPTASAPPAATPAPAAASPPAPPAAAPPAQPTPTPTAAAPPAAAVTP